MTGSLAEAAAAGEPGYYHSSATMKQVRNDYITDK
jgi:hypothetical protein